MINLSPDICRKIKEARRDCGLSQSVLAKEVGCKQSALSMFEQGDGTKLNDEVIKKLCEKFNIELLEEKPVVQNQQSFIKSTISLEVNKGFCSNPACPSHQAYEVEGKKFLKPNRQLQDPAGGKYCAICGEILEKSCPNCGMPVHDGAVCTHCGENYIPLV